MLSKLAATEPRHGEVWQAIAKDPRNAGKSVEDMLKIVVGKLE